MSEVAPSGHRAGGSDSATTKRYRRPSTPSETARRKAWAAQQAEIGYEWQRTRLGKVGK